MEVSAHRAFQMLKSLAYVRLSASPEEAKAAEVLKNACIEAGADVHIEEFSVPLGKVNSAKLVVTAPYHKEYAVSGFERSLSTPEGGLDAEFYYAEDLQDVHLKNCKGKIVMVNALRRDDYKKLQKVGPAAILTFSGSMLDRESETDLGIRKLRETLTEPFGSAIALNLRVKDAAEIVRRGAKQMHIEIDSECLEGTSRNVCCVIKGEKYPDEIVSFGAHFDSVHFSTGVYDNISGSVILVELMRYFASHKPARTLKLLVRK